MDLLLLTLGASLALATYLWIENSRLKNAVGFQKNVLTAMESVFMSSNKVYEVMEHNFEAAVLEGSESDEANQIRRAICINQKARELAKRLFKEGKDLTPEKFMKEVTKTVEELETESKKARNTHKPH